MRLDFFHVFGMLLVLSLSPKTKNIMKASTNTTVILKALDLELKALLQNDLSQFKAERNQATQQTAAVKRAA